MSSKVNHIQITLAREYRGYLMPELAEEIEMTLPRLVKIEKGIEQIKEEELKKISTFLNFPLPFFEQHIYNKVYSKHFMKR